MAPWPPIYIECLGTALRPCGDSPGCVLSILHIFATFVRRCRISRDSHPRRRAQFTWLQLCEQSSSSRYLGHSGLGALSQIDLKDLISLWKKVKEFGERQGEICTSRGGHHESEEFRWIAKCALKTVAYQEPAGRPHGQLYSALKWIAYPPPRFRDPKSNYPDQKREVFHSFLDGDDYYFPELTDMLRRHTEISEGRRHRRENMENVAHTFTVFLSMAFDVLDTYFHFAEADIDPYPCACKFELGLGCALDGLREAIEQGHQAYIEDGPGFQPLPLFVSENYRRDVLSEINARGAFEFIWREVLPQLIETTPRKFLGHALAKWLLQAAAHPRNDLTELNIRDIRKIAGLMPADYIDWDDQQGNISLDIAAQPQELFIPEGLIGRVWWYSMEEQARIRELRNREASFSFNDVGHEIAALSDVQLEPCGPRIDLTLHTKPLREPPEDEICAFCQEALNFGPVCAKLNACGHVFHEGCFGWWADSRTTTKVTCPHCRAEVCEQRRRRAKVDCNCVQRQLTPVAFDERPLLRRLMV